MSDNILSLSCQSKMAGQYFQIKTWEKIFPNLNFLKFNCSVYVRRLMLGALKIAAELLGIKDGKDITNSESNEFSHCRENWIFAF